MYTRRSFLATGTAAITVLPYAAHAAAHSGGDMFKTASGEIAVHPVDHASFVMETPNGVIYNDPVGGAEAYADLPKPDLILITHEHGDHYDVPTLEGIMAAETRLVTNPAVYDMLPEALQAKAEKLANGESTEALGYSIEAIPAYNITEDRQKYHPEGRDNGYILTIDGMRVYIAGDTEGTPEMRALTDIDLAFVPMNLPYTMDVTQAADAVAEFAPTFVYPYHYRDSDPEEFARLLGETDAETEVKFGAWYGDTAPA
ncbi:MBL fold metallo-hydrolase [Oceaniglobus roseus]|uniref:MBL fold metallo-hydrolase n=1 Tax=Oceaniglobus roseus TaxID=1737570 RepID=UPI000C7EE6D9|nr:MBL fold metallo-hydrolase [Kandeliimicrobium roseum]